MPLLWLPGGPFLATSSFWGSRRPSACGHVTPVSAFVFVWPLLFRHVAVLCRSPPRVSIVFRVHSDNPGWSTLQIFNLITFAKILYTNNVLHTFWGLGMWTHHFGVHDSTYCNEFVELIHLKISDLWHLKFVGSRANFTEQFLCATHGAKSEFFCYIIILITILWGSF